MKHEFWIKGMHCKSCEMLLKDVIEEINGCHVSQADFKKGIMSGEFPSQKEIELAQQAIEKEGYRVVKK